MKYDPGFIDPRTAALILKITIRAFLRLLRRGLIPYHEIVPGDLSRARVRMDDLRAYVDGQRREPIRIVRDTTKRKIESRESITSIYREMIKN